MAASAARAWLLAGDRAPGRLQEWERVGVWSALHREMLARLDSARRIDWSAGVVDGSHVRALKGA